MKHNLYTKEDKDVPECIKDRNGDVVLTLCKTCGKGEAELVEPCIKVFEEFNESKTLNMENITQYYYITTEPPMILSDEQINKHEDCNVYSITMNSIFKNHIKPNPPQQQCLNEDYNKKDFKKIIAGLLNQLTIDHSALSDEDCKKIGWVDVEKLALKHRPNITIKDIEINLSKTRETWVEGYKTRESLNDKKLSDEDMETLLNGLKFELSHNRINTHESLEHYFNKYIKQLNQPKLIPIEAIVQDNKVKILKVL